MHCVRVSTFLDWASTGDFQVVSSKKDITVCVSLLVCDNRLQVPNPYSGTPVIMYSIMTTFEYFFRRQTFFT